MNLSLVLFGLLTSWQTPSATEVTITNHTSLPKGFRYVEQADEETYFSTISKSKTNWRVKLVGDSVQVASFDPWAARPDGPVFNSKDFPASIQEQGFKAFAGPTVSVKVDDGWLFTTDNGEWGGGLYWFSPDWKEYEKLFNGNLDDPFTWNGGRYVLGGLDHMGVTRGYLIKVLKDPKGGWQAEKICDFESNPRFQFVDPQGNLMVVTSYGLTRVDKKGQQEQVLKYGTPFYPGSMVVTKNGTIYLGGTYYLLRLRPQGRGYRPEWMASVHEPS